MAFLHSVTVDHWAFFQRLRDEDRCVMEPFAVEYTQSKDGRKCFGLLHANASVGSDDGCIGAARGKETFQVSCHFPLCSCEFLGHLHYQHRRADSWQGARRLCPTL
jgi:hypothetical protein